MPCAQEPTDKEWNDYKVKELTQMLCYLADQYSKGTPWEYAKVNDIKFCNWYREHLREDKERLRREAANKRVAKAKKSALAKLTKEERILLGFNKE
jgi:hypothetical protein